MIITLGGLPGSEKTLASLQELKHEVDVPEVTL